MTRECGSVSLAEKTRLFAELEKKKILKKQDEADAITKRRDWHIARLRVASVPYLFDKRERWVAKKLGVPRNMVTGVKAAIKRTP